MTAFELLQYRLHNQHLIQPKQTSVGNLASDMVAMQAQDYLGALWAIGLRLHEATESSIETAISRKEIIRTWPMRGTLHFVAAEDAHWLLAMLAPRVIKKSSGIYKRSGLDDNIFIRSEKIITKALEGNQQLTRNELYQILEKNKIATDGQSGLHILGVLAQKSLICLGTRKGKQHTFVLFDEWFPKKKMLTGDEALYELTTRYFKSHGPATIQDFAWWSGLTLTEAKRGIQASTGLLQEEVVAGQTYFMHKNFDPLKRTASVHLLPSFDEYLVAYKNRLLAFNNSHTPQQIRGINGLLSPVIVMNGTVIGTWKRILSKEKVVIETSLFKALTKPEKQALQRAIKSYGDFLQLKAEWE